MSEDQPVSNIIYKEAIECYSVSQLKCQLFLEKVPHSFQTKLNTGLKEWISKWNLNDKVMIFIVTENHGQQWQRMRKKIQGYGRQTQTIWFSATA